MNIIKRYDVLNEVTNGGFVTFIGKLALEIPQVAFVI
jgi:hypothetical protein